MCRLLRDGNMGESRYEAGLQGLRHPVRPLVSIVAFILHTGAFIGVEEVLDQLPESIETESACYKEARRHLEPYLPELRQLTCRHSETEAIRPLVLDGGGTPLGTRAAEEALLTQRILEKELEGINSLLCGAHSCTLCCAGPDATMRQHYFTIPLQEGEEALFQGFGLAEYRGGREAGAETARLEAIADTLETTGVEEAVLIRHRQGRSLVLPRHSRCPALDDAGRCRIYERRPLVCRRPQIFPYLLEEQELSPVETRQVFIQRDTLLAVMDCPYVQRLQEEIARYAAASELELIFRRNKA